jgi:hypothetical protein
LEAVLGIEAFITPRFPSDSASMTASLMFDTRTYSNQLSLDSYALQSFIANLALVQRLVRSGLTDNLPVFELIKTVYVLLGASHV